MNLPPLASLLAAVVVLLIGALVNRRVSLFSKYNTPGRDFAARGSAQGTQVSVASARQGVVIPLNIAAAKALDAIAFAAVSVPPAPR